MQRDEGIKEMERLKFPEKIINEYKENKVMVSEDDKLYDINENQVIRDSASGVEFMSEQEVYHVISYETKDLGKAIMYMLAPKEEERVKIEDNECFVYKYYPNNALYCDFGVIRVETDGNTIKAKEQAS